jgi:hypothetical protein
MTAMHSRHGPVTLLLAVALLLVAACGGDSGSLLERGSGDVGRAKDAAISGDTVSRTKAPTSDRPVRQKPALPAPSPATSSPRPVQQPFVPQAAVSAPPYTVRPGDDLQTIATKQGVPDAQKDAWIQELLRANAIAEARLVIAGQQLRLPPVVPQPIVVVPAATSVPQVQAVVVPTATKTPVASVVATPPATPTPSVIASKPATVTPTATVVKPAIPTATGVSVKATPTRTPVKTPAVATPTSVKPSSEMPTATPVLKAGPIATPPKGNGGGPTLCKDGTISPSSGPGTCSHHGGIAP